jgi:hypothetical protein
VYDGVIPQLHSLNKGGSPAFLIPLGVVDREHYVTIYGKTQPKSFFHQMSMFMCFINLYHVHNILCKAEGITVSQIFCELLHFEMLVLENLEKSDF